MNENTQEIPWRYYTGDEVEVESKKVLQKSKNRWTKMWVGGQEERDEDEGD